MVPEEKGTGNIVTGGSGGEVGLCRMPGMARILTRAGARLFVGEPDT